MTYQISIAGVFRDPDGLETFARSAEDYADSFYAEVFSYSAPKPGKFLLEVSFASADAQQGYLKAMRPGISRATPALVCCTSD